MRRSFATSGIWYPEVSGLNLLSGAQPRQVRPVRVRVIGNGSYICSPAGFGHRSRCYSN
ncbi:hypothetical protein [Rhodophyticola porphyridii]|uniref:hypothetical protein n=1 Tax=Rhodophyticola porphyridii TaxID=1852017 RepID=UPI001314C4F4|nr:hypothetical protein [Rhodophyticola porphyridii]